jgi:hypothetical protein
VLSLLYYWKIASPETKRRIRDVVRKSLEFQQSIDSEVANPVSLRRTKTAIATRGSFSRTTPKWPRGGKAKMRVSLPSLRQRG